MRKSFVLPLLLLLILLSGCREKGYYQIEGTCPKDVSLVYLVDNNQEITIDSVIPQEGKFRFSGVIDENALLSITALGDGWSVSIINDGKPVNIDLSTYIVKGSDLNEKISQYERMIKVPLDSLYALYNEGALINSIDTLSEEQKQAKMAAYSEQVEHLNTRLHSLYGNIIAENTDNLIPVAFLDGMLMFYDQEEMTGILNGSQYASHPVALRLKQFMQENF